MPHVIQVSVRAQLSICNQGPHSRSMVEVRQPSYTHRGVAHGESNNHCNFGFYEVPTFTSFIRPEAPDLIATSALRH